MESNNERDWIQDFNLENGLYESQCGLCKEEFVGHKRRFLCKICDTKKRVDAKSFGKLEVGDVFRFVGQDTKNEYVKVFIFRKPDPLGILRSQPQIDAEPTYNCIGDNRQPYRIGGDVLVIIIKRKNRKIT